MKKRIAIPIIIGVTVVPLTLSVLSSVYLTFFHHYKGRYVENIWNETDTFNIDKDVVTLVKEKDKDFVILNLADVQMCDLDDFFKMEYYHAQITELVNTYKPNLITLTGDQTWSNENLISLRSLVRWLDDYKIPYAPIFGNHDYGNKPDSAVLSLNKCSDIYEDGKYSLFRRGPTNIDSLGNYVMNIKEEDKIISSIYMMEMGYSNEINNKQISWFKWNAEGIKKANNDIYPHGIVMTHKELPQSYDAYRHYLNDPSIAEGRLIVHMGFAWTFDNGFVDIAKSMGVYDFTSGHEHYNNYTLRHEDARYTFMVKTTDAFDHYEDDEVNLVGATTISLSSDLTKIEHHYIIK